MLIARKLEIDMGHRIPNHQSKCRNIHGHRYIFELAVEDKVVSNSSAPDEGMVIDFGDVKKIMMNIIDMPLDHGFMIYKNDPILASLLASEKIACLKLIVTDYIPTVENIASEYFKKLKEELSRFNIDISYLKVWETPNCFALFTKENFINE